MLQLKCWVQQVVMQYRKENNWQNDCNVQKIIEAVGNYSYSKYERICGKKYLHNHI